MFDFLFAPSPRKKHTPVRLSCEALEGRDVPAAFVGPLPSEPTLQASAAQLPATSVSSSIILDTTRLARANRLISTFENSTTTLRYDYIENINDGRGFTAGRVGFTTATGDLLLVVERYKKFVPKTGFLTYLPRLRELAASGSASTVGLEGFEALWRLGATRPLFRSAQNYVANQLYYYPAVQLARSIGVRHQLTLVALYDTAIQHGDGDDPDGLRAIIQRTNDAMGGTPGMGVNERAWLAKFLDERTDVLTNPANTETQAAWSESVDRVNVFRSLLQAGNVNFNGPLRYSVFGDAFVVP